MTKKITSLQNKIIKSIVELQKSRVRKKSDLFGIEGAREIKMAMQNDFKVKQAFFCPEVLTPKASLLLDKLDEKKVETFELSLACFQKIAVREDSDGLYVLAKKKDEQELNSLLSKRINSLFLVLDGIEKPGNLGAILRTADACGVSGVILTGSKVDLYNPHVIRTSLGTCFSTPVKIASTDDCDSFLQKSQCSVFLSYLDNSSKPYHKKTFTGACAIVIGSEADGISDLWLEKKHEKIIIPMLGQADSLNASVAASVLLFEAARQRNFSH